MFNSVQQEDVESVWKNMVSFANKKGGIIPGRSVSFKQTDEGFVLNAHGGRWLAFCVFLLVILFHFLPISLPFFMPVKKHHLIAQAIPLAMFGLFWIYLTCKVFFPIGKVKWNLRTSTITVMYGTIFQRRRLVIPSENVTLKMYLYKANRPDVRTQYGNIIFSLINKNAPDTELILASIKEGRRYKTISNIYNTFKENPDFEVTSTLVDMLDEKNSPTCRHSQWHKLVNASHKKRPFLFSNDTLIVHETTIGITIKNANPGCAGVMLVGLGLMILVMFVLSAIKEKPSNIILVFAFFLIPFFFIASGYIFLALKRTVILNKQNNTVCFQYGVYPFIKEMTLKKEYLEVRLSKCDLVNATLVKKPGQLVLSLIQNNSEQYELILSTHDKKSKLLSAYEHLKQFLGRSSECGLNETYEITGQNIITIPATSLSGNDTESKRKFYVISKTLSTFKSSIQMASLFCSVFFFGLILFIGYCRSQSAEENSQEKWGVICSFIFIIAMMLFCFVLFLVHLFKRCIIADITNNVLYQSPFVNKKWRKKHLANINDIQAVQLCSVFSSIQSGNTQKGTMFYEINAIINNPENKRITVSCGTSFDTIHNDAKSFAEFLNVPLLDNTQLAD